METGAIDWEEVVREVKSYTEPVSGMGKPIIRDFDKTTDPATIQEHFVDSQNELHSRGFLTGGHLYVASPATHRKLWSVLGGTTDIPTGSGEINGLRFVKQRQFPDGYVLLFSPEYVLMSGRLINPEGIGLMINVPHESSP